MKTLKRAQLACLVACALSCWAFVATADAAPPTNLAAPSISGTAQQGQTLTEVHGTWSTTPASYSYQWEVCAPTCSAIAGATAPTYVIQATDVGHTIEVQETAFDASNAAGAPATSAATAVVVAALPSSTSAPSISGVLRQGNVLTEQHGGWTNSPTSYTYQWSRCGAAGAGCVAIAGATAQTYTLTASDVGATLVVLETAQNGGGSASALSPATAAVAAALAVPVSNSPPTLSGAAQQGQTLQETHAAWTNNPTSYIYGWERCGGFGCVTIPGATSQTYTVGAADVGQTIAVVETARNSGGSSVAATSAQTAVVTATSAVSLTASPNAPTADQIVTIVATVRSNSANSAPSGSLTFWDGSRPISGCTGHAFTATGQSTTVACQSSFPRGPAVLSAVYTPAGGTPIAGSSSAPTTLVVGRSSTSMSLAVSKKVVTGKRAIYTATIALPGSLGLVSPTGTIAFLDGGRPIRGCRSRPLSHLAARCTIQYKSLGTHRISAVYTGDTNFGGSRSRVSPVRVVKGSAGPAVLGFVSSTLQWQFHYHPTYTQVTMLKASGLVKGITIALTCHGAGCPFGQLRLPDGSSASIDLTPRFGNRHLTPGSQIVLRLTRPHWIGKYYSFIVRGGRGPLITLACLGVGRRLPGAGC